MSPFVEATALFSAASGAAASGIWLAVEAAPTNGNVAAYLFGGGATVVLAGIVGEVARRLLNGSLIPRVIRDAEIEQGAAIVAAGQREDRVMGAVSAISTTVADVRQTAENLRLHNERLAADLAETTRRQTEHTDQTVTALARVIEDLRDEVRELRRGGQQ